ncbi:fibronectin type III domain-containing protein [Thermosulfurimonas sp. F29]|uniref:fibronectin type III domain-containing protein n=1 Tax=Thermosulfurimonas sp. F29 TaxID=2867247 RepID=UPI001C831135|nr:fibronectin type III domain-containing protein [Thermosulfurimonas sp. F29]MBX6424291.1 fibronectin type III domain-containing protein [Thermosulfurimonas sp. F29]
MRFLKILFLLWLFAARAGAEVFVPHCSPELDGFPSPGEYPSLGEIHLVRFYGLDQRADFYWCWDENYLYLAGFLKDFSLFEDGPAEHRWETWRDDSLEVYLHPDEDPPPEILSSRSRVIAFSISGRYWRVDRGENGHTVGLEGITEGAFGPQGRIRYLYRVEGTLNRSGDRDRGWSFELAIPWDILGISPEDGVRLRFNLYRVIDDDGGEVRPEFIPSDGFRDEWTVYRGDRYRPSEWEVLVLSGNPAHPPYFSDSDLEVIPLEGRRVRLHFRAPYRDAKGNPAFRYEIRLRQEGSPDMEPDLAAMEVSSVARKPSTPGEEETLEIVGLEPGTTYTLALRAFNEKGMPSSPLVTSFTTPEDDRIFVTVSPSGRTLALTDGSPFLMVPEAAMIPWLPLRGLYDEPIYDPHLGRWRNFYEEEGPQGAEEYLASLARAGVNTLMVGVESLDRDILFEPSPGRFNQAVFRFLDRLLSLCRRYGVKLLIRIYDTYYYREKWSLTPWYQLGKREPEGFFDPDLYPHHEARLRALLERYRDEPYILGWEILNEVDNAERFNSASFEARRAWLEHMLAFARQIDPHHLLFFTFVTWDPKDDDGHYRGELGMDTATAYRLPGVSLAVPHAYYPNIRDPHDPLKGPLEMSRGMLYAFYRTPPDRPVFDGESGPSPLYITSYRADFTAEDDLLFFTRNLWMHFASGGAGAPVRWPGEMFSDTNTISPEMRNRLHLFSLLVKDISWNGRHLVIRRKVTDSLVAVGRSDGRHMVGYVLNKNGSPQAEIPWPAEPGLWHIKVYSPFDGRLLHEDSRWIEERFPLSSGVPYDLVLLAEKESMVLLHADRTEYRPDETVRIFLDLAPFMGEEIWLRAEVNGKPYFISGLYPLEVSTVSVPLAISFDLPTPISGFPLFELPRLPPGDYCLGMKVGDFEDQFCWEVSQ